MVDPTQDNSGMPGPGDVVAGKYVVEHVLGSGGMGVVLSARHVDLGEWFAIKVVRPSFARHAESVARFVREARAAARIKSEHVARVHDVGRLENGAPYMVMEYLAGLDLDQHLRQRGPLHVEEALDYVLQACEAIAEAHASGVVHRDLKPANLFLTRRADGSPLVKVLDFGMSKAGGGEAELQQELTATASVLGSPHYMSPEQVRSSKNIDARSDVWALGVILHRLLTGGHAFAAETLSSCLAKIVMDPPASVRERAPWVPAPLEAVVMRCLEKDVSLRLQSVAVLAVELAPFAPRSQLSIERIVNVLGLPQQRPAAAAAPYPGAAIPRDPASVPSIPSVSYQSASQPSASYPSVSYQSASQPSAPLAGPAPGDGEATAIFVSDGAPAPAWGAAQSPAAPPPAAAPPPWHPASAAGPAPGPTASSVSAAWTPAPAPAALARGGKQVVIGALAAVLLGCALIVWRVASPTQHAGDASPAATATTAATPATAAPVPTAPPAEAPQPATATAATETAAPASAAPETAAPATAASPTAPDPRASSASAAPSKTVPRPPAGGTKKPKHEGLF